MHYFIALILGIACFANVKREIHLKPITTVFVPVRYGPEKYEYDAEVGEQLALDAVNPYIYTVGNNLLHIIDFADPENAAIIDHVTLFDQEGDGVICDVTTCKDWVAVMIDNVTSPMDGRALVYTRYNPRNNPPMELIAEFAVGPVPDSSAFTSDCSKLLVVIEGEPRLIDDAFVDPEGGAGVLDFNGDPGTAEPTYTFVDFNYFNDKEEEYRAKSVRKVYNGQGSGSTTTFSQDMEPENVAISYDDKFAYFSLQENNAIAVLDVDALTWVDIYPMGYKSYDEGNEFADKLDTSNDDDGINIGHWPIRAFYGADSLKFLHLGHSDYLITANEGDTKEYDTDLGLTEEWVEVERGENLLEDDLISSSLPSEIVDMLNTDAELGRLEFSMVDGLDSEGKIEHLYAYGGRSVSLYRVSNMSLAFDTASNLEEEYARLFPGIFNSDARDPDSTPEETFDSRSDNKGTEPEALDYAIINNQTVIFVGMERPGLVAIYTVAMEEGSPTLNFESMFYGGGPLESGKTFQQLYDDRELYFSEAEDLKFIPADRTTLDNPLLVVSGSVSGTIAFFDVIDSQESQFNGANKEESHLVFVLSIALQVYFFVQNK